MGHKRTEVAHRRVSRRRTVRVAGNLLVAIGFVLLSTSIVAATHGPTYPASHPPQAAAHESVHPPDRATVYPTATAPAQPSPAGPTATPRPPTLLPTEDPAGPFLPHAGEGLIAPVPDVRPSSSPYLTNSPASPPATHISVPAVGIDTDVVEVAPVPVQSGQQTLFEWAVADWAAGHHSTSANPGDGGNIVIAGHDDVRGEVFRGLHDIEVGDEVILTTANASYTYVVQEVHMRLYRNVSLEEQLSVSGFIEPMPEERVTLITCWPYGVDTHRLIVVAKPKT